MIVVGLVSAAPAFAGDDGIVLESYAGERPADANKLLAPVLDELGPKGFASGADVGRRFEARARPALTGGGLAADFGDKAEQGHKAWVAGRFDDAVTLLSPLVNSAHANSGAFAQNQSLREKLLKALIALALSYQRIGDQDAARKTFGEILRSYPETALSRASYGPDAYNAFEEVRKAANAGGRGKLNVRVSNGTAVIFINERFQNVGSGTRGDLLPGEYRVVAQVGKQLSRSHRVTIVANEEAEVKIDADLDAAVHTSPEWSGLVFADSSAREKNEAVFAAAFANAIVARGVIIVGIDQVHNHRVIYASLVHLMNGRELRRASINLDTEPPEDKLRALAKFIGGDSATAAPGIDVQLAGDIGPALVRTPDRDPGEVHEGSSSRMWGGWKYLTGVAALGALGVGGYLLSVDGDCSDAACAFNRETSVPGWATIGGGAVLAGVTVYLFVRGSGASEPKRSAFVVPARGGAYAGFSTRF